MYAKMEDCTVRMLSLEEFDMGQIYQSLYEMYQIYMYISVKEMKKYSYQYCLTKNEMEIFD